MKITDVQVTHLTRVPYAVLNTLKNSPRKKTYSTYKPIKSYQGQHLILEKTLLPEEQSFIELSKETYLTIQLVEGVCFVVSTDRPEEWEFIERILSLYSPLNATAYKLDGDSLVFVLIEIPHALFRLYSSLFESMIAERQQEAISA